MNKDIQDIQRLLDRFLEGTSTLEEEKRLADYFHTHEVDEEWSAYKEMFAMFDKGEVEVKEKKSRAIPLWVQQQLLRQASQSCSSLTIRRERCLLMLL